MSAFLEGHALFLGALAGILVSDFWICRRKQLSLPALYSASKTGVHYFTHGYNWRAFVAFFCGIAPNLPGLAKACNSAPNVPKGAIYLYTLSWHFATLVAGIVYFVLHKTSPMEILMQEDVLEGIVSQTASTEVDNGAEGGKAFNI
ncbi:hypothetical protein LTR36_009036 [Oleoguttula mirabilis]|uniref:Uncharacterized protein n=1 Tax=Oleoguttula mirabilis TaxID=1507867 RepID=A0AAV9J7A0_9PEZI|nr:hypothetical protein LTR36_009036 [Oleoguttula mirabilis]